jgi:hypothetical protein
MSSREHQQAFALVQQHSDGWTSEHQEKFDALREAAVDKDAYIWGMLVEALIWAKSATAEEQRKG